MIAGLFTVPVYGKEIFKDEAGRVLYTVDDDGSVSMFENSPTDLTISVTRGSREQMQPQITEVSPSSVAAGASPILRLKGKNLVGATVKLSAPTIEIGAYTGKPKSLDLPLRVPAAIAPGPVVIEVTTPIGNTKTTVQITELRIGGSEPAKREVTAKKGITTAAPATCPDGMVGVAAERGGFCIEIDQTFAVPYPKAEKACAISGKRLCQALEWRTACEEATAGRLPLKDMLGDWEWTGTQAIKEIPGESTDYGGTGELRSILLGQSNCKTERDYQTWRTETISGRCCK
ncbi:MAG TPA: hypothetical protein VGJ57_03995 [Nitrospirales bacterium]